MKCILGWFFFFLYNPSVTETLCGDYKLTNLQLTGISRFQRTSPSFPMPAPPPGLQSEVGHGTVTSTFSLDSFTFKLGVMVLSRSLFFRPVSRMFSRDRSVNMSLEGEERGKCLPGLKMGDSKINIKEPRIVLTWSKDASCGGIGEELLYAGRPEI